MNSSRRVPGKRTRINVAVPVQVSGMDIEGREVSSEGLTINLSPNGACLRLGFEVPLGAIVAVRWQDDAGSYEAHTRLCWKEQKEDHWHVGVEALDQPYSWSKLFYTYYQSNSYSRLHRLSKI
jgi:hypothetical protein